MNVCMYVCACVCKCICVCVHVCMHVCMHVCFWSTFSHTKSTPVPGGQKLLHGTRGITPPIRQGFRMPKQCAPTTHNLLLHSNAEITPRVAHPVQCFPLFRAHLSVEEIMFGELKYNIIPILHTRAGKLPHLKWACLMLGIYGGKGACQEMMTMYDG